MNHFPIRDIWKIRHIWKIIHFGKDIFDLSSHIFPFYLENMFLQHWEKVKVIFSVSISVWSGHLTTMWNLKEINIPQSLYDIAVQSDNAYAVSTDNLLVSRRSSFSYFAFSSAYSRSTQLGLKQMELTTTHKAWDNLCHWVTSSDHDSEESGSLGHLRPLRFEFISF